MANNCDYCHKPLSLMRRLRGEQFCSIEHMDLYAAQQAEFALERLAASVTDSPNTERPPSLNRPAPKLRPKPTGPATAPNTAPAAQVAVAEHEHEIQAVPEPAIVAQAETRLAEPPPTPNAMPAELEYPMAAHLAQNPVEAKSTAFAKMRKEAEFAPVEHWGKVSPTWSMPAFHSEPGDVRTWNAGKVSTQIPPAVGHRELLTPVDVEPLAPAVDADAQLPMLPVSVDQIATLPTQTALHNEFPEPLTQFRSLQLRSIPIESNVYAEQVSEVVWVGPTLGTVTESVRNSFRMAENRLDGAARQRKEIRPQTLPVEWQDDLGGPQFTPQVPLAGAVSVNTNIQGLESLGAQRRPWSERAGIATDLAQDDTLMGPELPQTSYTLPAPEAWSWTESFDVPVVSLPDLNPAPMPHSVGLANPSGSWQDAPGTPRNPVVQWVPPHLGHSGPTFGWESFAGKPAQSNSAASEGASFSELEQLRSAPHTVEIHAHLRAMLSVPGLRPMSGWSTPKVDNAKLEVGPLMNLRPTVATMAIQVRPLVPVGTAHLESVNGASTLAPSKGKAPAMDLIAPETVIPSVAIDKKIAVPVSVPALRAPKATLRAPKAAALDSGEIPQAGPVKYSPVAIVVVPPPQFALLPAALRDEQRYAAQVPNGVWHLPRVRHTGYRALGPFPKLPLRLPDRYLKTVPSEVPSPFTAVPLHRVALRQDLAGMPSYSGPRPVGVHPADYLAWPEPKGLKTTRTLPEQQDLPAKPVKVRKFGPGRAGLQTKNRSADGQARNSA